MLSQAAFNSFLKTLEEPCLRMPYSYLQPQRSIKLFQQSCRVVRFMISTCINIADIVEHLLYVASRKV